MTERVKLENPGDELTLTVGSVSDEDIGGYAYWKIVGQNPKGEWEFVAPQKSIAGQLDHVGLGTAEDLIGYTVKFSRSIKLSQHKKPYWNLDLAEAPKNGAPPVAKSASSKPNAKLPALLQQPTDYDEPQAPEKPELTKLYLDATEFVLEKIVPKFEEKEIGVSDTAIVAAIATIFIAASKER